MSINIYVADARDPCLQSLPHDTTSSNLPKQLSPTFPPHRDAFRDIYEKAMAGEGVALDWGAWAIRVTKRQLLDYIATNVAPSMAYSHPVTSKHLHDRYRELLVAVHDLPKDGEYLLVAYDDGGGGGMD